MDGIPSKSYVISSGEIIESGETLMVGEGTIPTLVADVIDQDQVMEGQAVPMYSAITPATIQNEDGEIQQVYVTFDREGTIRSINEHPASQANLGMTSSVVTVTYPEVGDMEAAQQMALLAAHQGQATVQHVTMEELPNLQMLQEVPEKAKLSLGGAEHSTSHSVIPSQMLAEQHQAVALQQATALHDLGVLEYSTQPILPQKTPASQTVKSATEPEKFSTEAPGFQIFSNVCATLSNSLLEAIPGTKAVHLSKLQNECDVTLEHNRLNNTFVINADMSRIIQVEKSFNELLGRTVQFPERYGCDSKSSRSANQSDKEVMCDLLKPQFSRSGRELKPKTLDLPDDYHVIEPEFKSRARAKSRLIKKKKPTVKVKQEVVEVAENVESTAVQVDGSSTNRLPGQSEDDIPGVVGEVLEYILQFVEEEIAGRQSVALEELAAELPIPEEDGDNDTEADMAPFEIDGEKENGKLKGIQLGRKKQAKDYEKLTPFKYFCSVCSFKSKRHSHIMNHLKIHEKNLPLLRCGQCSFTAVRLSHLRRHELSHADSEEVYECPKCKYKTGNAKLLSRHLRMKHHDRIVKEDHPVLACEHCDYKTLKSYMLSRHLKCHTGGSAPLVTTYQCELCPYKSVRKEHFLRHSNNVHQGHRPYMCEVCGKAFKRTDALRQHRMVHIDKSSRNYQFHCPDCQKPFRSKAHLKDHMVMHSTQRQYLCELCGAAFKTRSVQRKHILSIHKNPRAHSCPHCDKKFNTKYTLLRHLRTHTESANMRMQTIHEAMVRQEVKSEETLAHVMQQEMVQEYPVVAAVADDQPITAETITATAAIDETLEGTLKQLPQAFLQTEEGTTFLYLANL